eukprot:521175-Prymnesium_polylepis.1
MLSVQNICHTCPLTPRSHSPLPCGRYGLAVLRGHQGRAAEALEWLTRAASQRTDPVMLFRLGMAHRRGLLSAESNQAEA